MPADGETVLSKRARARLAGPRPLKGLPPLDPSTDLLTFLKPHALAENNKRPPSNAQAMPGADVDHPGNPEQVSGWEDSVQGAESELRAAWRVNFADLNFRAVTAVTLAAMLGLCVFVVVVMPSQKRRNHQTDGLEYALVTLLTVMFSPLSFNYAYVWLIFPTTLALHLVLSDSTSGLRGRLKFVWIITVIFIPALAIPMPLLAQAYGNLFVPALVLLLGLGMMLYAAGRRGDEPADDIPNHRSFGESHKIPQSRAVVSRS